MLQCRLPGATRTVLNTDQALLVRRADSGEWAPVSGILEPGEHPAIGEVREVLEETGVVAVADRLASTGSEAEPAVYPNGDVVRFVDLTFACRYRSGEAQVGDDESTEVGWFSLDALPRMADVDLARIVAAVNGGPAARFEDQPTGSGA